MFSIQRSNIETVYYICVKITINNMAGFFVPFLQYHQDLIRSMSGLCQVYPSKQVTLNFESPSEVKTWVETADADARKELNNASEASALDYGAIRNILYKAIADHVEKDIPDDLVNIKAPSMADINFLSHEIIDGWLYNDIYINVTPEQGKKTFVLQESGGENNPGITGFAINPDTGDYLQDDCKRSTMTFNAVVLYYNLYMVDPEYKTASTVPVVVDMPLGIYVPESSVTIKIETEALYGQGTSWSTRICSRLAGASSYQTPIQDTNKSSEYATLTKILSQFGNINKKMDEILHSRNVDLGLNPYDIKSYLDELRKERAINVPYIKDGHWFVNGRDIGETAAVVNAATLISVLENAKSDEKAKIIELLGISAIPPETLESL